MSEEKSGAAASFRATVPDCASLHPGYEAGLPASRELPLVRRVIRLIHRKLVHGRLPQMLGKALRRQIDLTFGDALGEGGVEIEHRAVHAEQRAQPVQFSGVAPL